MRTETRTRLEQALVRPHRGASAFFIMSNGEELSGTVAGSAYLRSAGYGIAVLEGMKSRALCTSDMLRAEFRDSSTGTVEVFA